MDTNQPFSSTSKYGSWDGMQLQAELERRALSTLGDLDELRQRLLASDQVCQEEAARRSQMTTVIPSDDRPGYAPTLETQHQQGLPGPPHDAARRLGPHFWFRILTICLLVPASICFVLPFGLLWAQSHFYSWLPDARVDLVLQWRVTFSIGLVSLYLLYAVWYNFNQLRYSLSNLVSMSPLEMIDEMAETKQLQHEDTLASSSCHTITEMEFDKDQIIEYKIATPPRIPGSFITHNHTQSDGSILLPINNVHSMIQPQSSDTEQLRRKSSGDASSENSLTLIGVLDAGSRSQADVSDINSQRIDDLDHRINMMETEISKRQAEIDSLYQLVLEHRHIQDYLISDNTRLGELLQKAEDHSNEVKKENTRLSNVVAVRDDIVTELDVALNKKDLNLEAMDAANLKLGAEIERLSRENEEYKERQAADQALSHQSDELHKRLRPVLNSLRDTQNETIALQEENDDLRRRLSELTFWQRAHVQQCILGESRTENTVSVDDDTF